MKVPHSSQRIIIPQALPVSTIEQMYEQRNKDINKAGGGSILRLVRALGCEMEDIMEP